MNYGLQIKTVELILLIILLIVFALNSLLPGQDYPVRSGSIIFLEKKCHNCHSVKSQAIECNDSIKKFISDLSTVGDSLDTDILKSYLTKKFKLLNKKHPIAFKGKKEDLDILCNWLHNLSSVEY